VTAASATATGERCHVAQAPTYQNIERAGRSWATVSALIEAPIRWCFEEGVNFLALVKRLGAGKRQSHAPEANVSFARQTIRRALVMLRSVIQ